MANAMYAAVELRYHALSVYRVVPCTDNEPDSSVATRAAEQGYADEINISSVPWEASTIHRDTTPESALKSLIDLLTLAPPSIRPTLMPRAANSG